MSISEKDTFTHIPLQGRLLFNEPLADYTTWRVGGKAKCLYKPRGIDDLAAFVQALPHNEPLLWLGLGSNSLIKDNGFPGTVIVTQGALNEIQVMDNNTVRVQAGVSCAKMARFCARNNLVGGEFWAGIPGTMGGALRMNAGCFNGETWSLVTEVETITRDGQIHKRTPDEFEVAYRHVSGLREDEWFVSATCSLSAGDKETSLKRIKELLARRAETQPTSEHNCGSVFRNPPNHFAAQLIESCGLKGISIGGAMVSQKHANFIINHEGKARASDIESLIALIQTKVFEETGFQLRQEVHTLGEQ